MVPTPKIYKHCVEHTYRAVFKRSLPGMHLSQAGHGHAILVTDRGPICRGFSIMMGMNEPVVSVPLSPDRGE